MEALPTVENLHTPTTTTLKILVINLFSILYKAATMNVPKLFRDMREVRKAFPDSMPGFCLQNLIPLFLLMKFFVDFFSLTTKVIAMLPILTDDYPEMILPSVIGICFENLLMPLMELILGYVATRYTIEDCRSMLSFFTMSLGITFIFGVTKMNIYMNFYIKLIDDSRKQQIYRYLWFFHETFLNKQRISNSLKTEDERR